jgi:hypothetical protein
MPRRNSPGVPLPIVAFGLLLALAGAAAAAEPDNGNFRRRPGVCTMQYDPVCGVRNGVSKTYSNACFAAADGAKVVAKGPCRR